MAAPSSESSPRASPSSTARILLAGFVSVAAAALAWSNSFSGPFVFDDRPAILANPSLENFSTALSPPRDGGTVAGRPLVNLSLALNRAVGGTNVGGYHVLNLFIHVASALVLSGLVRRTLAAHRLGRVPPRSALAFAFVAALLWVLHPLQTSAVTYVVQRAESLMALCFLLTLYCFVRARESASTPSRAKLFAAASVASAFAGVFCKEVMVVAPVVVLLYDRTFIAGTFASALRARWRYYLCLAVTWLPLAWLVSTNAARAGTAGFAKISPLQYVLTQCEALVHYLALAFWPTNLVFDYGTPLVTSAATVWPQLIVVSVLLSVTAFALRRAPVWGFLGATFFLILAPSSSIVPIATQTIAEHRMYLPLAVLAIALAGALHRWSPRGCVLVGLALALPLGITTFNRNTDYRDALTLWADTARKRPDNPRAHNNVGIALAQAGRTAEAISHYETARKLAPEDAEVHNNLANALSTAGRTAEALSHYETAVRLKPSSPAHLNLANALVQAGRGKDAIAHYEGAEKFAPLDAAAHCGLAVALANTGRIAEAIPRYERALALAPDHAQAHYNLGVALARTRRYAEAVGHFQAVTRVEPANIAARVNLGNVLLLGNRAAEAIVEYEAALRLAPSDPQIRANLTRARAMR